MSAKIDLRGQRFGRLTVTEESGRSRDGLVVWMCKCDCGGAIAVHSHSLRGGNTNSCGCLRGQSQIRHGMSRSTEYEAWSGMRGRCNNKSDKRFCLYGARGIKVCERWDSFENFLADMGEKPNPKDTLDRIDTNGNYEPSNCRWTDWKTQQNNRRNNRIIEFNGERLTASQWQDKTGIRSLTILQRIDRDGWSIERALKTPLRVWPPK